MAGVFSQDAVLHFLQIHGGSVKNSDLLLHFRNFIRNHPERDRNRENFKRFVNSVATVRSEDGVSYVILRKKFRGHVPGDGPGTGTSCSPSPKRSHLSPAAVNDVTVPAQPEQPSIKTTLPAAGIIVVNNNNKGDSNLKHQQKQQQQQQCGQQNLGCSPPPEITPVIQRHVESHQQGALSQLPPRAPEAPVHHGGAFPHPHPHQQQQQQLQQDKLGFEPPPGTTPVARYDVVPGQQGPLSQPLRVREALVHHGGSFPPPHHHQQQQQLQHDMLGFDPPPGTTPVARYDVVPGQQGPLSQPVRVREAPVHHGSAFHHHHHQQQQHQQQQQQLQHDMLGFDPPPGTTPVARYDVAPGQQGALSQPLRVREAPVHHGGAFPLQQQQQQHQRQLQQDPRAGVTPVTRYDVAPGQQGAASQPVRVKEAPVQHRKNPAASEPSARLQCTSGGQQRLGFGPSPVITPGAPRHAETRQQGAAPQPPIVNEEPMHPRGGGGGGGGGRSVHQEPPPPQRRFRYRPSYKTALSRDDDDDDDEEEEEEEEKEVRRGSAGGVWPHTAPLEGTVRALSASSPSIPPAPSPSSSFERSVPKIYVQDVEAEAPPPRGLVFNFQPGAEPKGQWAGSGLGPSETPPIGGGRPRHRFSPSPERMRGTSPQGPRHQGRHFSQDTGSEADPRLDPRQRLSSSHSSIFSASPDRPPSCSSAGSRWSSSYEDVLQATAGQTQATRPESETSSSGRKPTAFHHSVDDLRDNQRSPLRVAPWYLSSGDLYDNQDDAESSDGSGFSSPGLLRPAAAARGRLSGHARSRMCRSLGADLDQYLEEEEAAKGGGGGGGGGGGNEAARLSRLQLLSSSLSLRYNLSSSSLSSCSTPPRCHSVGDLMEAEQARGRRSLPSAGPAPSQPEGSDKQSLVPLEPKEHDWLVKGAAGAWPDIYSLFRDDPSLLNKRDFISGFTVLHWIAKHGDHRVLNTLWYGVQKAGTMFDINARSTSGHTALHLAAIHGHKNIMRLLVKKFGADVNLRDNAGKKPWQCLSGGAPLDVYQLLGAPARVALRGDGGEQQQQKQQQRRRRRHHFSTASGERPLTIAGTIRVKRSSSIAALLKHKSLRRFHAHKADDLV